MDFSDKKPHHGRGWSFPPSFNRNISSVAMTDGVDDINRSLEIIISTDMGERIMNPTFGCGVSQYVFGVMDSSTLALIEDNIRTSIILHEARVDVEDVNLDLNGGSGTLDITIYYKLRNSNSRFNFVFPYYLKEANSI